ncbi:MAG: hypothetical protein WC723_04935 [Candidatus Omnitrophota bacterium]
MDEAVYSQKQKEEEEKYEARCKRCGSCCGAASGDVCTRLSKDDAGRYYCTVYDTRIGQQKTISGVEFSCVPIRYLRDKLPFKDCAYYKDGQEDPGCF